MRPLFIQYGTGLKYEKYGTISYFKGWLATLPVALPVALELVPTEAPQAHGGLSLE